MEWVKCSDRLPELGDYSVLAYFSENGGMDMVHVEDYFKDITNGFDGEGNQLYSKWYLHQSVTHWHPMPDAPEND